MIKRHRHWLFLLGLAIAVVAKIYFRVDFVSMVMSGAFMVWLVVSAFVVGAIPRKPRTRSAQIVCSIIGWPMFLIFLVLMAVCVWTMVDLDYPGYMLLIGFLWVLTHLTWKIFIHPTIKGHRSN